MLLKKKPYGNHKMFSVNNKFLAHVDTKRMDWYLDRCLAKMINGKDFKLSFVTKGDKDRGEYYKLELTNNCVVCGESEDLTKHHVVPHQYRKFLPTEYKSKSSFDVLCLCNECHNKYEIHADELKESLLRQYNLVDYTKNVVRAKRNINALENYAEYINEDKKQLMINFLEDFFDESLDEILDNTDYEFESASTIMMNQIKDLDSFVVLWRRHFIEFAEPRFLPKEWYDEIEIVIK